jgi:hypothetical protein
MLALRRPHDPIEEHAVSGVGAAEQYPTGGSTGTPIWRIISSMLGGGDQWLWPANKCPSPLRSRSKNGAAGTLANNCYVDGSIFSLGTVITAAAIPQPSSESAALGTAGYAPTAGANELNSIEFATSRSIRLMQPALSLLTSWLGDALLVNSLTNQVAVFGTAGRFSYRARADLAQIDGLWLGCI